MGVQQDQTALTHPHLPNFSVYVTAMINGQSKRLPVWDAEVQGNRAIGWIEAVEGTAFSAHFDDYRPFLDSAYSMRMYLDGAHVNGLATRQNKFKSLQDPTRHQTFSGQEESALTERPFLFSNLKTTDDDDEASTDENLIKNLGTISLKYRRAWIRQNGSGAAFTPTANVGQSSIHEKAKKAALSHQATVGASVAKRVASNRVTLTFIDPEESPLVSFEFRYRSRQLLQLEGHQPDDAPLLVEPLAPVANGASGSNANNDGLSRKERIAKMRAEMAQLDGDSDDEELRVDVKPKKVKLEDQKVKAEKGVKTEGKKVKQEVIILSDSD